MTFKRLVQTLVICCGILAVAACSKNKCQTPCNPCATGPCMAEAEASGAGQGSSFGGGEGMNAEQLCAKRTYYFDFDQDVIHPDDQAAISANANKIACNPHVKVLLEGHTDPRGSREYNVGLGERRAKAVKELLESKGVSPSQIRIVSYGSERPAAQGCTEDAYALDRRVVLVYLK